MGNGIATRSRGSMRLELVARVRARQAELEQAILIRIGELAASDAGEGDAGYLAGLHAAVTAAVEHGLQGIEQGLRRNASVPAAAVAQARRAARAGVSVDTVLRRYMLGSTLIGDFLMQEADRLDFSDRGVLLREMLADLAGVLNHLMSAITDEYTRELHDADGLPEQRRIDRVRRLLAGEHCDTAELGYRLEDWHLGVIASDESGEAAAQTLKAVAGTLGMALLHIPWGPDCAWAWFGGPQPLDPADLQRALRGAVPADSASVRVLLALGEAAHGVEGWRTTHRQAQAALRVALRSPQPLTRYADVALLAAVLRDDGLADSLVEVYLGPLGDCRGEGKALRETLRAYLAAERHVSSAASALGVGRHTVQRRLRLIEDLLGPWLRTHRAELDVALRLEALGERADAPSTSG